MALSEVCAIPHNMIITTDELADSENIGSNEISYVAYGIYLSIESSVMSSIERKIHINNVLFKNDNHYFFKTEALERALHLGTYLQNSYSW